EHRAKAPALVHPADAPASRAGIARLDDGLTGRLLRRLCSHATVRLTIGDVEAVVPMERLQIGRFLFLAARNHVDDLPGELGFGAVEMLATQPRAALISSPDVGVVIRHGPSLLPDCLHTLL